MSAASFAVEAQAPTKVGQAFAEAAKRVRHPKGGLVFTSGHVGERLLEVAEVCAQTCPGVPLLLACGAGVLSERGEIEGQSAATGIIWAGGRADTHVIGEEHAGDLPEALVRITGDRASSGATVITLVRPEVFSPDTLVPLRDARVTPNFFGAGTVGNPGLVAVDREGNVGTGAAALMIVKGISPPQVRVSPACRLVSPLRPITEARGSMVLEIDGEPALDVLAAVGRELEDQPLLFAVLAAEEGASSDRGGRPQWLIRGVQGVDPTRRALVVSTEVRDGMRIAFGIRDGGAARADLEAITRELQRDMAGAAPRFGLYLNCAGRGSSLYDNFNVDTRILTSRFRDLPLAGMQSSLEIGPHAGRPAMQLYTGVLALFTAPS